MTERNMPDEHPSATTAPTWLRTLVWVLGFSALSVYAVHRLKLLPLTTTIAGGEGATPFPRAFFTVDHPFHTARADLIRSAWASFDTVRWVANHQGGYPAEFFPFGLPAVGAIVTILSAGAIAIEIAWSITIVVVFLLPGLGWFLIGRADRLSPCIAFIALSGQIAIASDWMHGGFTELVEWGLATNVAGATYALMAIPLLVQAVEQRSTRSVAAASVVIALCAVSNPRSLIAVTIIAVAIVIHTAAAGQWREGVTRVGVVALLSVGLAAPVVVPLIRYSDLYFFLSYQEYAGVDEYWRATLDAATWPVLLLAAIGVLFSAMSRSHRATQATSIALVLYMSVTAVASASPSVRELIPQLELPRLMPFQRLLIIYLAAYGAFEIVRRFLPLTSRLTFGRDVGLAAIVSVVMLVVYTTDAGPFDPAKQGLRDVPRTEGVEAVELHQFREAVSLAGDAAPADTAVLVLGSRLSWHEQLWAPMVVGERRFYYDNWLWYWHQQHDGPYDYLMGHHYPNPSQALTRDYLETHGIGAVVITDIVDQNTGANARDAARSSDALQLVDTVGGWDVYGVQEHVSIGTINGQPAESADVSHDNESITLTFSSAEPGTMVVRQNWFPRWTAKVNGEPADVERAENGYIEIQTSGGDVEVTLTYGVTSADAMARAASVASALVVGMLLIAPEPMARLVRRLLSAGRGLVRR